MKIEEIEVVDGEWKTSLDTIRDALLDFYLENYADLATGKMTLGQLRKHQERIAGNLGWDYEEYLDASEKDIAAQEEKIAKAFLEAKDKRGMRSVKHGADDNPGVSKMDFLPAKVLKQIANEQDLDEADDELNERKKRKKKRKKKRPGNPDYYEGGTRKSNKSMAREINKCAKEPRPKSCYDYWSADKQYDKAKKESQIVESVIARILSEVELSKKTRDTLKKKAKDANMPLGALTGVYSKGLAAWLTGHRQGTPQHAWAMGRVNSFIRGGKTRSVDKAEWEKVQKHRKKKRKK